MLLNLHSAQDAPIESNPAPVSAMPRGSLDIATAAGYGPVSSLEGEVGKLSTPRRFRITFRNV